MNAYFVTIYSVSCYTDNVILYTLEHLLRVLIIPLVITFIQTSKLVFTFSIFYFHIFNIFRSFIRQNYSLIRSYTLRVSPTLKYSHFNL